MAGATQILLMLAEFRIPETSAIKETMTTHHNSQQSLALPTSPAQEEKLISMTELSSRHAVKVKKSELKKKTRRYSDRLDLLLSTVSTHSEKLIPMIESSSSHALTAETSGFDRMSFISVSWEWGRSRGPKNKVPTRLIETDMNSQNTRNAKISIWPDPKRPSAKTTISKKDNPSRC